MGREEAMRRIESLAGRQRGQQPAQAASKTLASGDVAVEPSEHLSAAPLERSYSNPMPVQYGSSTMIAEPALPQTPTTRRRQMLATELPENLRLSRLAYCVAPDRFADNSLRQISSGNAVHERRSIHARRRQH